MVSKLKNWLNYLGFHNRSEPKPTEKPMEDEGNYGSTLQVIVLERFKFSDQGTLGRLLDKDGEEFHGLVTIELPWRNNARSVSCIPRGDYMCSTVKSPRFGHCYHVRDVPGRSHILFHHGNFAGDTSKGMRADSNGCILLGYSHSKLQGQDAVLSSRLARSFFETTLDNEPFLLKIRENL